MLSAMRPDIGRVITATGPVDPATLHNVPMHEHLHCDFLDGARDAMVWEEHPATAERRAYLLAHAAPLLREARERFGMTAFCEVTMPPWRVWPDVCVEISEMTGTAMILATGFYREMEVGVSFVTTPERSIWPFVRESSVETLADFCIREIVDGIHGMPVRAGCIKLGSSAAPLTPLEAKTFKAGARAQLATGVHITTHCTILGAESSQLTLLEQEGVDLNRVIVGHTAWHISDISYRKIVMQWMARGAGFMPTNLDVRKPEQWQSLVDAIHQIFDAGHGDKLYFSLDHGYGSASGVFDVVTYLPPSPWTYLFTDVLPAFRKLGLTAEEERAIMTDNPRRVLPVVET